MRTALWALVSSGCVIETATIEEGCLEELPGAPVLGEESTAFLERANCYRRYLGLAPLGAVSSVQASVLAHGEVIASRGALSSRGDQRFEGPDEPGFTGAEPFDREVATGAISASAPFGRPSVAGWYTFDAEQGLDDQLGHPGLRDVLFQTGITGVGYAAVQSEVASGAYLEVRASIPSGVRVLRPIVFPKDGAEEVSTAFRDPWAGPGDPFHPPSIVGYPVTVTFGAAEAVNDIWSPLALAVTKSVLTTEVGVELPHRVYTPGPALARVPLRVTVAFVPDAELPPDTEITLDAEVAGYRSGWKVRSSFRTGPSRLAE